MNMKIHSSRLTAHSLYWFLWDAKEPTPLFEKSRGDVLSGYLLAMSNENQGKLDSYYL